MIEVGEYVRTKNGLLGKVNKIELSGSGVRFGGEFLTDTIIQFNDGKFYERRVKDKDIANHSKNIIDLIEVGDYVNGIPIEDIEEIDNKKVFYSNGEMIAWTNRDKGIETILTKEQYMQNCYKCQYIENGTI